LSRKASAGVLLYRFRNGRAEVLLVHPGGPFWQRKDEGAWSLPKGEFDESEEAEAAARREFAEETGLALDVALVPLTPVRQRSGKVVHPFAGEADIDVTTIRSNLFPMEWPPKSGKVQEFPEVDRGEWLDFETAARKIVDGQRPILEELQARLQHALR
jgi:predicted NUDIX family NTP pyrophosphohydrolase